MEMIIELKIDVKKNLRVVSVKVALKQVHQINVLCFNTLNPFFLNNEWTLLLTECISIADAFKKNDSCIFIYIYFCLDLKLFNCK